jgi:hypothetical protein
MNYDLIGDIHGHAEPLLMLLQRLGYEHDGISFYHPNRKVIFLGDFIDGGPEQLEVLSTARAMVEHDRALAIMGNHEFNAIGWALKDQQGEFLRPHTVKNQGQHQAFLDAVGDGSAAHHDWIQWFLTLPVWLDLPELQVVHACWDIKAQHQLSPYLSADKRLKPDLLSPCFSKDTAAFLAIEKLMKGPEVQLPAGVSFTDKYQTVRTEARLKWWSASRNFAELLAVPPSVIEHINKLDLKFDTQTLMEGFNSTEKPTFVGHYWLTGEPEPLSRTVACLDYSVARNGTLVAYRFSGESTLCTSKFIKHQ